MFTKKQKRGIGFILAAMVVAAVTGVVMWPEQEARPLTMVVIPVDDADTTREKAEPFREHMVECMGTEIRLVVAIDYTAVVEAMKYKHADIGKFGGFSYVMAVDEANVEAIAKGVRAKTGLSTYRSLFITWPGSGFARLEDLEGATVAFTDPGSTSGYLAPVTALKEASIEPGETGFAGGHDASALAVINKHVDAAAVSDLVINTMLEDGEITDDQFEVIWESDPIPGGPIAVREDMDSGLKSRIQACICSAPQEAVELIHHGRIRYDKATDADYNVVRTMAKYKE